MRVLCKVIAGSKLFGTDTPESDLDYKGVFIPEASDILMGNYNNTIVQSTNKKHKTKNTRDDIDVTFYSLKKFFGMIFVANNHALEILFAPDNMVVETSPQWEYIRRNKYSLICKQVQSYINYCKGQAAKYGVKGSRVNSVMSAIDLLKELPSHYRLNSVWKQLRGRLYGIEHISFHEADKLQPVPCMEVNTRKFQNTVTVEHTLHALEKIHANYGDRAKQAANNEGIDWKAISHAYRVGIQAYELLRTGHITLPIKKVDQEYIKQLKANKDNLTIPFDEVRPILEKLADNLKAAVKESGLREKIDEEKWNGYVKQNYAQEVISDYL